MREKDLNSFRWGIFIINTIPFILVLLSGTNSLLLFAGSIALAGSYLVKNNYETLALILCYTACGIGSLFCSGWGLIESFVGIYLLSKALETFGIITETLL